MWLEKNSLNTRFAFISEPMFTLRRAHYRQFRTGTADALPKPPIRIRLCAIFPSILLHLFSFFFLLLLFSFKTKQKSTKKFAAHVTWSKYIFTLILSSSILITFICFLFISAKWRCANEPRDGWRRCLSVSRCETGDAHQVSSRVLLLLLVNGAYFSRLWREVFPKVLVKFYGFSLWTFLIWISFSIHL